MSETDNRQILLAEKPSGKLGLEHFKLTSAARPVPRDGEVLVRVRYISLDAANRAWMHGATYRSAVEANSVMAGGALRHRRLFRQCRRRHSGSLPAPDESARPDRLLRRNLAI